MGSSARAARQGHFYARTWHCSVNKGKNPADLQMGVDGTAIGQKTKGGDEQLRAEESPSHFLAPSPSLIVSSVGFRLGGCPLSSSPLCCLLGRPASRPLASVGLAYQTDKGKDERDANPGPLFLDFDSHKRGEPLSFLEMEPLCPRFPLQDHVRSGEQGQQSLPPRSFLRVGRCMGRYRISMTSIIK